MTEKKRPKSNNNISKTKNNKGLKSKPEKKYSKNL